MKYLLLLGFLLLSFTKIHAQSVPTTSVTISPVHLTIAFVEVTVENLTKTGSGVAGIIGFGEVEGTTAFELGLQYNNYIIGSFEHGLEIGIEALFASAFASNIAVGPQIGYKVIIGSGFTIHTQIGYAYNSLISESTVFLNFNTGWSI